MAVSTGPSDQDLVLLMRRRQPGAFAEVYRRYHERIWRFLQRLTGHRALGEDLFQDTWLAAARNAHRLREDSQVLPWLYTIARNKHRNSLRFAAMEQRRREQAGPLEATGAPEGGMEASLEARAQAERVATAFRQLTEAHREVLLLCLSEGLDSEAAARVLDVRPEAVRKRLSRARAELARLAGFPQGVNHE
jgi:RNA polymerase sigma-70 factor (ECF subfamily)